MNVKETHIGQTPDDGPHDAKRTRSTQLIRVAIVVVLALFAIVWTLIGNKSSDDVVVPPIAVPEYVAPQPVVLEQEYLDKPRLPSVEEIQNNVDQLLESSAK